MGAPPQAVTAIVRFRETDRYGSEQWNAAIWARKARAVLRNDDAFPATRCLMAALAVRSSVSANFAIPPDLREWGSKLGLSDAEMSDGLAQLVELGTLCFDNRIRRYRLSQRPTRLPDGTELNWKAPE